MAHNDCSIRREGAKKISEKKNWGACSKGTAARGLALDHFRPGGTLDRYRLPHPLIGKLTLRELLLWTLYHNAHHVQRIAERREHVGL